MTNKSWRRGTSTITVVVLVVVVVVAFTSREPDHAADEITGETLLRQVP